MMPSEKVPMIEAPVYVGLDGFFIAVAPFIPGYRAHAYFGPVRVQASDPESGLEELTMISRALGANALISLECDVDAAAPARWSMRGTAAKLERMK